MTSAAVLTAVLTLGVHWGWQPVAGGGIEYIIRIDPYSVDSLSNGHDVFSDLPPSLPSIRSYRITVSDKPVPHEGEPLPLPSKSVSAARPPAEATGQPSLAGELQLPPPPSSNLFPPPRLVSPTGPAAGSASVPAHDPRIKPTGAATSPARASASAAAPASQPAAAPASEPANSASSSHASEPARPWAALAGVSIGLFASLAANAWLVWIAWGFRAKYLEQIARLKPAA